MRCKRKITSGKRNSRYYARGHINPLLGSDAGEESFFFALLPSEKLAMLTSRRKLKSKKGFRTGIGNLLQKVVLPHRFMH